MVETIKNILAEASGWDSDDIKDDINLIKGLGLSSLDVINLVIEFEDAFEIEVADEDIKTLQTVGDVIAYIEERA